MLHSDYRKLEDIKLPLFQGRQKYMHTFDLSHPEMSQGFEDYLPVVKQLCNAAGAREGLAHMTVDEKVVAAGMSQRRPGPHVDGCFVPAKQVWGHPEWRHYCNNIGKGEIARMPVIVAASVAGCVAWRGEFDAQPKSDGDLTHIRHMLKDGDLLAPNVGFLLSPDCVHESVIFHEPTERTFLRIALPVDFKWRA